MNDPIYVDDPFEEDDTWRYPQTDRECEVLRACGLRSERYQRKTQSTKLRSILFGSKNGVRRFDDEYIDELIAWAKKLNAQQPATVITLNAFISAVHNQDNIKKYMRRKDNTEEKENYDIPSGFN